MLIRVLTALVPDRGRDDARMAEPVTFGVPLPRGLIREPVDWAIESGVSGWRRVQTYVTDRWSDGSARWVLVDAQIDSAPGGKTAVNLDTQRPDANAGAVVKVVKTGNSVVVDTGAARFELQPGVSFPFVSAESADGLVNATASRLTSTSRRGNKHDARIDRVAMESPGPLRAVVRLDGRLDLDDRALVITARLHFFAGLAAVRLTLTVTNPAPAAHKDGFWDLGDPGSVLFEDLSLVLSLNSADADLTIGCSSEPGLGAESFGAPFALYQDSSGGEAWQSANHINRERRIPLRFRGYRLTSASAERSGLRSTPVVTVRSAGREAGVAFPRFWQNFPKAVEVEAGTGALVVRFFPGQFDDLHEIQGGEQKTHACWLSAGSDAVSHEPLQWCRQPTQVCVDPEWTMASNAVPFLGPLDDRHASLVASAVDGPDRFEVKREVIDEYGWRHFGDIYGDHESVRQPDAPLISHYNNQYDVIAGFIMQYLRTADVRWWTQADELAAHVIDIDIYHTDRDKSAYNGGLFWHTYHYGDADTATHRSYPRKKRGRIHGGGPSADHNYTFGLLLHHMLTGDEASRDAVIGLASYVVEMDDGRQTVFRWLDRGDTGRAACSAPGYYGPGRGPANSLAALVDGFRMSGDERFLRKAEQLIARVVHPKDDFAAFDLDNSEQRWFYTMFLQSLVKFLAFKDERGETDRIYQYSRATLMHYVRWMAASTYPYLSKPEKVVYPTETWPAQDIRKSDVFIGAAQYAETEQERATFIERGEFFHSYSVDTLRGMPARTLARPVVILLTSGLLRTWITGRKLSATAPFAVPDFGQPSRFEPQRSRAVRRFKQLAAAGFVGFVLAAIVWGFSS